MTQAEATALFLPKINLQGNDYTKFAEVDVRAAIPGECIVTVTSDGEETKNHAGVDDVVVRNHTEAQEQYILTQTQLKKRYAFVHHAASGWDIYRARGECRALRYDGEETTFLAIWNAPMILKPGDWIVTPLPDKNEVYRIAQKEFKETYKLKAESKS